MEYFKDKEEIFLDTLNSEPPCKKPKGHSRLISKELDLVTSCYSFLSSAPDFFRNHWCWSPFLKKFIGHKEPEIRWVTYQCLRYLLDMDEQEVNSLVKLSISSDEHRKYTFKYETKGNDIQCASPLMLEVY